MASRVAPLLSCLCLLALAGTAGASEHPLSPAYRVKAAVDMDAGEVKGTVTVTLANGTGKPLDALYLALYPNAFLKPSDKLNDINYEWVYPTAFNPGFTEVERATLTADRAYEVTADHAAGKDVRERGFLRLGLAPALAPGARCELTLRFRTRVPEKFGPLSVYDDLLTANGGWYPYLPALDPQGGWHLHAPPPFAKARVEVTVPEGWEVVLGGVHARDGTARFASDRVNVVSLSVCPAFHAYRGKAGDTAITYFREDEDADFARRVLKTARTALAFFGKRYRRPVPGAVGLVEARIRSVLTMHAGPVSLVSDRILRVLPYPVDLRKYHLREVAYEVFYLCFQHSVSRVEDPRDAAWIAEGCAWRALRAFLEDRSVDFDEVKDLLGFFSFIPIIDQILVAPRFPFNDVFFDTFYKSEPHRESIYRWNNRTPYGRIVIEKLRDALPRKTVDEVLQRYLAGVTGTRRLRDLMEKACGHDLAWFWRQWRKEHPRLNYAVGGVKTERLGPKRYRVSVEIQRRGGGKGFKEYVNLGVVCENGKRYHGRVLVDRASVVDTFVYPDKPEKVILDPFGRSRETNRSDNKSPRSFKLLITQFYPLLEFSPDFSDLGRSRASLDIFGGFAAIAEGDYSNQVFLNYFYESRGFGLNLGYMYSFGFKLDRTAFPQGVGAFIFFEKLDKDFAKYYGTGDDGDDDQLITGSLRLFYVVDTRIDPRNPHKGFAFRLTFEYADKILGTDFRYTTLQANLRWIFSPVRHHVFAFQARADTSWGELPRQRLFSLGGYYAIRGMEEDDVLGSHRLFFRCEYRHLLWNELDINFFWIGYIRRLGGVLFLEVGSVTDRGIDLFRTDTYAAGIGYGFKVSFDSFGVRPFIIGMDLAFRLDETSYEPEIYFTIAQSF